jgi:hypothetical protein
VYVIYDRVGLELELGAWLGLGIGVWLEEPME